MAKNKNKDKDKEIGNQQEAQHANVLEEKRHANQGNKKQVKFPRSRPPAYLKKLNPAVRDQFASAMALPTFLERAGTLTLDDRILIVRQALILIEQNYVHLPLKRAMHSIDPVRRLKLLLWELEQPSTDPLPSEVAFHREMTEIFTSLRDLHTNYMLPEPFRSTRAFLPFMVEGYMEDGKRKYIVSNITSGSIPEASFVEGVEVLFWNGIPIEQAVLNNAQRYAGSNREAQHARSVTNLTTRSLYMALPPDEAWVFVGYETSDGNFEEIRIDWTIVKPALPSSASMGSGEKGDFGAAAAMGLDLEHHLVQQMRKALFAPQVVAAEQKITEKMAQGGGGEPLGPFDSPFASTMPSFFTARSVDTPSGTFGHLRIRTFNTYPHYSPDQFVSEFIRLVSVLPQNGLIIDVRGNGGGTIMCGEEILQVLTPRRIEPEPVQFINTPLNLKICQQNGWLDQWVESIQQSLQTGAVFSAGFPISDPERCNVIGQRYFGPVVLITDAQCYSTTDFFAAGFQDHEIGPILGADGNTGAGGANVWTHEYLHDLLPETDSIFQSLPNGAGMRVAIRRGLRVGKRAGMPVEDLGVIPDVRHFMTKNDLLNGNVDLINRAGELLADMQPVRAFALTLQYLPPQIIDDVENNQVQGVVNTQGMTRLDIYLNDRPLQSIDVLPNGQTTFLLDTRPSEIKQTLEIRGFADSELVARYREILKLPGPPLAVETQIQFGFQACNHCGGLFYTDRHPVPTCKCKEGVPHATRGNTNRGVHYIVDTPGVNETLSGAGEHYWRFCGNCQGLFRISDAYQNSFGVCNHALPGDTAHWVEAGSAIYILKPQKGSPTAAEKETAYFECSKCGGVYHNWSTTYCNAGGAHTRQTIDVSGAMSGDWYYLLEKN